MPAHTHRFAEIRDPERQGGVREVTQVKVDFLTCPRGCPMSHFFCETWGNALPHFSQKKREAGHPADSSWPVRLQTCRRNKTDSAKLVLSR